MYLAQMECRILLVVIASINCCQAGDKPNIIFIVADDMGNNDIGYNNPEIKTPNIDRMAKAGIILDSNYVYHLCTPSRAAFMTGRYTYKLGLQHYVITTKRPAYVKNNETMIAERLKEYGYRTHIVGKWNLGYCKKSVTPLGRGFDSFYGFYNAEEDYYTYEIEGIKDFRQDSVAVDPENSTDDEAGYATFKYAARAERILDEHKLKHSDEPIFMYIPFNAPHSPLQAPARHLSMYSGEYEFTEKGMKRSTNRTTVYAMVSALDEAIGRIYNKLDTLGYLSNTFIAFTSDNGGDPRKGGFNNPYRGRKFGYYEGGIRVPGFVYSQNENLIREKGYRTNELFHATDWFPTFLSLAGGSAELETIDIDGRDQSDMLKLRQPSARDTVIINMNEYDNFSTVYGIIKKVNDDVWKYVEGIIGFSDEIYTAVERNNTPNPTQKTKGKTPCISDKYLFKLSDDVTEKTNLYSSSSPLPIQHILQSEIEAEKLNITAAFAWEECTISRTLAEETGWWKVGNGENGWCLDKSCKTITRAILYD